MTSTTVNTQITASERSVSGLSSKAEHRLALAIYAVFMLGSALTVLYIAQASSNPLWVWGLTAWTALVGLAMGVHMLTTARARRRAGQVQ